MRAEATVSEIRPIDDFRVCPLCLVVNSALDADCSGCGSAMPPLTTAWADLAS